MYVMESDADIPGAKERSFTTKTFLSRASCYSIYTSKNGLGVGIKANILLIISQFKIHL